MAFIWTQMNIWMTKWTLFDQGREGSNNWSLSQKKMENQIKSRFLVQRAVKYYYRRSRLLQIWHKGAIQQCGTSLGRGYRRTGLRGAPGNSDCHRASSRNLNISTDEVFTISSCNLFQYGTTGTLNACWRRLVLYHRWGILKVWPRSPSCRMESREGHAWSCTYR